MLEGGDGAIHGETLAQEAGPIRRWLTRYFGRRIRNHAEVEDMVQEVFVRIAARDTEAPIQHLGGYVSKTASSVLIDWARRRSSRQTAFHIPLDMGAPETDEIDEINPERVFGGKEDLHAAIAALLSLPKRTRTVFILCRLDGLRHREIALRLGISVSAVEKHLSRGISHLSLALEKRRDP